MLSRENNELMTRVGAGTPMGSLMCQYWLPVLFDWELPEPDCTPVRVRASAGSHYTQLWANPSAQILP
jgi:phthalate 4,5-dioxygenase